MEKELLKFLENNKEVKVSDLVKFFKKDRTTIYRWLKKLEKQNKIEKIKKWVYRLKPDIEKYFEIPVWERKKVFYNPEFLRNYKPA